MNVAKDTLAAKLNWLILKAM